MWRNVLRFGGLAFLLLWVSLLCLITAVEVAFLLLAYPAALCAILLLASAAVFFACLIAEHVPILPHVEGPTQALEDSLVVRR